VNRARRRVAKHRRVERERVRLCASARAKLGLPKVSDVTVEQVTSELVRVIAVNHVRMQAYTCRDLARFAYDPRLTYKLEHRAERLERRADRIARGEIDA